MIESSILIVVSPPQLLKDIGPIDCALMECSAILVVEQGFVRNEHGAWGHARRSSRSALHTSEPFIDAPIHGCV